MKNRFVIAACVGLLFPIATNAAIIAFTGADATATSRATGPAAVAAEAAFLAAAGATTLVTFENTGLPSGNIIGQSLSSAQLGDAGNSISITVNDPEPPGSSLDFDLGLDVTESCGFLGFNVTVGGAHRLAFCEAGPSESRAELIFNFASPIDAFGLYLSGGSNFLPTGIPTLIAGADTIPVVTQGSAFTGLQYIGFTSDTPLSQVIFRLDPVSGQNNLFFGVDDVSFSLAPAAAPEPATLLLLGLGLAGLGMRRRAA